MSHRLPARTVAARWIARLALVTCFAWTGATAALAETMVPPLAREEDRARLRVTAFATGLGYPTSMTTLADGQPQAMATKLPGLVTSVRRVGDLVFALCSQSGAESVTIWRTGSSPIAPFTPAGRLSFTFPAGFEHTTDVIVADATPQGGLALYFKTGAKLNSASTPGRRPRGHRRG